jgi:signal peptidase I
MNYVVLSESMIPVLHPGDLVITNPIVNEVEIGDIVTFQSPLGGFLIHRVMDTVEREDKVFFVTKGDANPHVDSFLIPEHRIIGKLLIVLPRIGSLFLIPRVILLVCNMGLVIAYVVLTFRLPHGNKDSVQKNQGKRTPKPIQATLIVCMLSITFIAQSSIVLVYPSDTKNVTTTNPFIFLQEGTQGTSIITDNINANISVALSELHFDDFVDTNTSNVDGSTNIGILSNFTAQQSGPDFIYDVLTENTNTTSFEEYLWITGNDDYVTKLDKNDPGGTYNVTWDTGLSYPFGCEYRLEDGNEYIYVVNYQGNPTDGDKLIKFHADNGTEVTRWDINGYSGNAYGLAWNGSRWFIANGGADDYIFQVDPADPTTAERSFTYAGISDPHGIAWDGSFLWVVDLGSLTVYQIDIYCTIHTSCSYNYTSPSGIAYDSASGHLWITDSITYYLYEYDTNGTEINSWDPHGIMPQGVSYAKIGSQPSYQLDLEVQFTGVENDYAYEELCIYGGTMGAENITVDIWNGTTWTGLFQDLVNGWNNVSISNYLTSSTLTIRFKGGTETADATQDNWNIDATFLRLYGPSGEYDYVSKVNNTDTTSFQTRLKKYDDSNITRLLNCTVYFHNGSGSSNQLVINEGIYIQELGDWYDLPPSSTIYVAASISANSTATSTIYSYLEIKTPNNGIYAIYEIAFEIT